MNSNNLNNDWLFIIMTPLINMGLMDSHVLSGMINVPSVGLQDVINR